MTVVRWLGTVFVSLLGPAIEILIVLVVIVYFEKAIVYKETLLKPFQRTALFACACASLPIAVAQLSGTNYILRLISAAMIPLAIAGVCSPVSLGGAGSEYPSRFPDFFFSPSS